MFDAGAFLGGVVSGAADFFGTREQNKANREMAREQMAFQERMSNSAYQRGTADMRAAGLNPLLAYGQGGASSPGGASAQMENVLGGAATSAMEAMRFKDSVTQARKNIQLSDEQIKTERERQGELGANTDLMNAHRRSIEFDNEIKSYKAQMYRNNPWLVPAEKIMDFVSPMLPLGTSAFGAYLGSRFGRNSALDINYSPQQRSSNSILLPKGSK